MLKIKKVRIFLIIFSVITIIGLLCGLLNNFRPSGSTSRPGSSSGTIQKPDQEPETPKCEHRDMNDDSLCDFCGEAWTDGNDIIDPSTCNHINADDDVFCDNGCGYIFEHEFEDDDNNGSCDECENYDYHHKETPDDSTDIPEETLSFGGSIVKTWDITEYENTGTTPGGTNYTDNVKTALKNSTFSCENGWFSITSNPEGSNGDIFAIFGYDTQTYIETFSYYVIDTHIAFLSGYYPFEVSFIPDVRGYDYKLCSSSKASIHWNRDYLYNYDRSIEKKVGDSFHLTLIIDQNGNMKVYVDGLYIFESDGVFDTGAVYLDGLKVTSKENDVRDESYTLALYNMYITSYDVGYEGMIHEAFSNTEIELRDCLDSAYAYICRRKQDELLQFYKNE